MNHAWDDNGLGAGNGDLVRTLRTLQIVTPATILAAVNFGGMALFRGGARNLEQQTHSPEAGSCI